MDREYSFEIAETVFRITTPVEMEVSAGFECFGTAENAPLKDGFRIRFVLRDVIEEPKASSGRKVTEICRRFVTDSGERRLYYYMMNDGALYAEQSEEIKEDLSEIYVLRDKKDLLKTAKECFRLIRFSDRLASVGKMMLHASFIRTKEGKGILFLGSSGTGKSTQAELWERYAGAEIINGDRAIAFAKEDGFWGFGSPYSGSSRIVKNTSAPLCALVLLAQANDNSVRRLDLREAAAGVLPAAYMPDDTALQGKVIAEVNSLISTVPSFLLKCTPDEGAVRCLERVIANA